MPIIRRFLREPLVHFVGAGALIYLLFALWAPQDNAPSRRIVVDRAALLQYLQYQAKAFEPGTFNARFEAMSAAERSKLIDDYVREEVLYREAEAMGLAKGDYVIRRRQVQKMQYLLEEGAIEKPTDAELQQYLRTHAEQYRVAPAWTFTHVFVDSTGRNDSHAAAEARTRLQLLNARMVHFNDAPRYSDRFPFLQNYVERTAEYIGSQFGPAFLAELAKLSVDARQWQGPLRSDHGWHLVLLTGHTVERDPTLAEIRAQVQDDYRRDRAAEAQERAIHALIGTYRIDLRDVDAAGR